MFTTDIARTAAAIACTILFSATAVIGAVGPGVQNDAGRTNTTVAATARLTA